MDHIDRAQLIQLRQPLRDLIVRYIGYLGRIQKILAIRSYLIDQFHVQKGTFAHGKYRLFDRTTRLWFELALNLKRRGVFSMGVFPCNFKGRLEILLFDEADRIMPDRTTQEEAALLGVCYNWKSECLSDAKSAAFSGLDEAELLTWQLRAADEMTQEDKEVVRRYITLLKSIFDAMLDEWDEVGKRERPQPQCRVRIKREHARVLRVTAPLAPEL